MKKLLWFLACVSIGASLANVGSVQARDQFKKAWDAKYIKTEGLTPEDELFIALAKRANCNICHEGTDRKKRNDYGKALNEFIKTADVANVPKIHESMDTVAGMPSKPGDDKAPSFGDLIKQGKLPVEFVPPGGANPGGALPGGAAPE